MVELINKWDVVNKLIQLENNYQFYKEQWDADVLYRRICELEIGIGKTPAVATDNNVGHKWIPVTEMLPDIDGRYLVLKNIYGTPWCDVIYFAKDGRKVDKYDFRREWKNVWYRYDSEWGNVTTDDITHWMPLPEPPKGE